VANKRDIGKLLRRGLTGWEAGLLILEDSWISGQHLKGLEGFLSDSDISNIKAGLKTEQDIKDYNQLMQLYRIADYINREADRSILGASMLLERAAGVGYLRLAPIMAKELLDMMPQVMTEKQYKEERKTSKERWRQRELQEIVALCNILLSRATHGGPKCTAAEMIEEPLEVIDFLREKHPAVLQKAIRDIVALIKAGKLKPAQLSQEDIEAYEGLEEQSKALYKKVPGRRSPNWTPEAMKEIHEHSEKIENFLRDAYKRASKDGQSQDIIRQLSKLKAGSLSEEEGERLLDYTYCLGEELYQAGLPEWIEYIDADVFSALNAHRGGVAIISKPLASQIDKRGYYKEACLDMWPLAPMKEAKGKGWTYDHSKATEIGIRQIQDTLACRQVLREVGCYLGLALDEMIAYGIRTFLKPAIERYNLLTKIACSPDEWDRAGADQEYIEQAFIDLDKLKPAAKQVATFRGWISEALGEHWWKGQDKRHAEPRPVLKELVKKIDAARELVEEAGDEA
jgi:hypothetical protein